MGCIDHFFHFSFISYMNIWVWNLTWHSTSPFRTQESRLFSNQLWQNINFFVVKTGESLPLGDDSSLTASATVSSSSSTLTPQYWRNYSHFRYAFSSCLPSETRALSQCWSIQSCTFSVESGPERRDPLDMALIEETFFLDMLEININAFLPEWRSVDQRWSVPFSPSGWDFPQAPLPLWGEAPGWNRLTVC